MSVTNWKTLSKKYKGRWVALKRDEKTVVSSGRNAEKVYFEAKEKGVDVPIMHKVPSKQGLYIGQSR